MPASKPRAPKSGSGPAAYVLPFPAAAPREAIPDAEIGHPDFPDVVLVTDETGIAYPTTTDQVRMADVLGLPVITQE